MKRIESEKQTYPVHTRHDREVRNPNGSFSFFSFGLNTLTETHGGLCPETKGKCDRAGVAAQGPSKVSLDNPFTAVIGLSERDRRTNCIEC